MSIGPALPPGFLTQSSSEEEEEDDEVTVPQPGVIGPRMPTSSGPTHVGGAIRSYGPALPPGLEASIDQSPEHDRDTSEHGSSPTHSESDDSDGEVIGPLPPARAGVKDEDELERRKREIDARSQAMKDKLTGKSSEGTAAPKREEWMTELPVEFKPLGIGARKFRTKVPETGDRSVWTDTPADRQRKAEEARSGRREKQVAKEKKKKEDEKSAYACVQQRDVTLAQQVDKYNKEHRSESLVELHRKRRADELRAKGEASERRPFDRERDLEAPRNMVTPAKRRALAKDSKLSLDSKFQHGSRSFL